MIVVVDASVVLKWLIADDQREPDTASAIRLMRSVSCGELQILQPLHWLIEVVGVLVRFSPQQAAQDALMLQAMRIPTAEDPGILRQALDLAIETQQHVFDTLYHAVALRTKGAVLITADDRYRSKAKAHKSIIALRDWSHEN